MAAAHAASVQHVLDAEHEKYFTFVNVALALTAITFVELIIIILPFHSAFLFGVLVLLSLVKFGAVIWWFMHLRWDLKLCTLLFLIGLFLATGTVAALMVMFEAGTEEDAARIDVSPPPAAEGGGH